MRRPPWKLIGLAGLAGVAATGVVVARRRNAPSELEPDEIRQRLHDRLAETREQGADPRPPASEGV
jgi:hypothetical protein